MKPINQTDLDRIAGAIVRAMYALKADNKVSVERALLDAQEYVHEIRERAADE